MSDIRLNVADMRQRCTVDGPGLRSVVWVQGCTLRCPGCYNPHMQPHVPATLLDPEVLGRELAAIGDTDGVTIMGGEPFEQAQACTVLAHTLGKHGKSVMVFSGYPFAALAESPDPQVGRFLKAIDLLIAGPYLRERKADLPFWRTSDNQTIHFLTDRFRGLAEAQTEPSLGVEIATNGHDMVCVGFPEPDDLQWLDRLRHVLPCRRDTERPPS